jgi:tetratricopeptide (TPR) repeat protein
LRSWKVLVGLGVVATLAIIGITLGLTLLSGHTSSKDRPFLLPKALARLEAGHAAEARELATLLRYQPDATFAERGGAMYVLGSVLSHEARDESDPTHQRTLYLVASRYLEEANTHGFPPECEADGLLALGRALYKSGRFARAMAVLREALETNPHAATELHVLLAESGLALTPPQLAFAREHTKQYLALGDLSLKQRHAGQLLESRILLAGGDTASAEAAVADITDSSPLAAEAIMQRAQIAITAARASQGGAELTQPSAQALTAAIASLRTLEGRAGIDRELVPQAQLLVGHCYDLLGDRRAAVAQFDRLRRVRYGRPDGLAAAMFLAELHRQEGRAGAALELYRRAILQAGPKDAYHNPWLPLAEFESRLVAAAGDLVAKNHFAEALALAESMGDITSESISLRQRIAARGAWARQLLAQAAAQPTLEADVTRAEARRHLRQAGADGERLAALGIASRQYVEDLVAAAENYQQGQGYRQAARVWREFLRQNPREQRPEAMVRLGEALLALGEVEAALTTLQACCEEFTTHPVTYRARVLASQGWLEKGDLARSKDLLADNLYRHSLTPQSSDWRDSLYGLGRVLYLQGQDEETRSRVASAGLVPADAGKEGLKLLEQSYASYQEAIRVLTEAIQRYPAADQAVQARYWIAESYRHSALWPRKKLDVTSIETSRLSLNRQITQELEAALDEYQWLLTELSDEQKLPRRTAAEMAMLRNCYFGRADAMFDLGRFEEAIRAYSDATNRYQHDPESLEAYVQIATCYRRLKRPNEARGTLEQARAVLDRIRPDADFLRTTRLDRQQWNELLTWMRTL